MVGYVTLEEAAQLENISYEALKKKAQREPDTLNVKHIKPENGGRERVLVSVQSLSKRARRLHKAKNASKLDKYKEVPWYVYVDYNWYKEKYPKYFYKAVEEAKYVREYLDNKYKANLGDLCSEFAKKCNMSERSFLRRVKFYDNAIAAAMEYEADAELNYEYIGVLALARKPREDKTFPSLSEELQAYIENIFYDIDFRRNNRTIVDLYEELEDIAEMKGLELPSYDTVWRYVNYILDIDGEGAKDLVGKGIKYWKNKWMIKRLRNTYDLKVLEMVVGDVHTFDFWVRVLRPNGKWQAIRPCLVAWVDMKSRAIVGWVICECPDSQIIKESLINVIYPKKNPKLPYGVPRYILIDNGKEYTAESLTGRPRTVRFTFDEDTKGYYRSIGIEDDVRSKPFEPWSKAQVERWFGTVCTKFSKRITSYTGTLSGSKTNAKVEKNIKKMLENEELITIDEVAELFEKWVVEKYHPRKHRGLIQQGEESPAPIHVFNNSEKYYNPAPPIEFTISQLMKGDIRVVRSIGIQRTINGKSIHYNHPELMKYQGKKVQLKYFPEDITKVLVYDMEGKRICEAVCYELLKIAPKVSQAALEEHIKMQKRHLKSERQTVNDRLKTYEERQQEKQLMLENAGKKKVAPEIDAGKEKVVAMVNDSRYREDVKHKQASEESKPRIIKNEYFDRKAKEAMELLAKLG